MSSANLCGNVAPQPHPPPSVPVEGHPRWGGWEPLTCQLPWGHDGQHKAGALAQKLTQIFEVLRGHGRSPMKMRVSLAAISGNGSTAEQSPAFVT